MRRPIVVLAVVLVGLSLACGQSTITPDLVTDSPATTVAATDGDRFAIAIEYAVPGLAEAYAATGVAYAKPMPVYGVWANVEPEPGEYDWGPLDAIVLEYQEAGFSGVQLLLSAESPWASSRQPSGLDKGDTFPQEDFLDDYAAFVRNVVERYDGDGVDDAPGLIYPVHHYGIEREFTGFWPSGDAEDYVRLLRIAYPEIHAADPEAEVLLVALLMVDVFDGAPGPAEVERRLRQPSLLGYSLEAMQTVLAACDAYDVVDFHSLGDYTEIPPTVAWLRAELERNGCGERPIWIGDAFSMSALVGYGDPLGVVAPRPFFPATEESRDAAVALLESVADPASPDHDTSVAWLRAEMARGLVKKIVVAAGEGLAGINIGNLEDWVLPNVPRVNVGLVRSLGASAFMGMMDTTLTGRHAGGPLEGGIGAAATSRIRQPGDPRPAFYALQLVVEKIDGFTSVEKMDLGTGVWAYRFETADSPVWVLWYDDGQLHLPGDPLPTTSVDLTIESDSVLITRTPTLPQPPEVETLESGDERFVLTLDSTPIFVQLNQGDD